MRKQKQCIQAKRKVRGFIARTPSSPSPSPSLSTPSLQRAHLCPRTAVFLTFLHFIDRQIESINYFIRSRFSFLRITSNHLGQAPNCRPHCLSIVYVYFSPIHTPRSPIMWQPNQQRLSQQIQQPIYRLSLT